MRRPLMAVCMCLVILFSVLSYMGSRYEKDTGLPVEIPDGMEITVSGRVYRKDIKNFYLDSVSIIYQAANQQHIFQIKQNLICDYDAEAPAIGSEVVIKGSYQCFWHATNPGEFDSAGYYETLGIGGRLKKITIVEEKGKYSYLQEGLFRMRCYFRNRLYEIFPTKQASIMTAMLLGDKSELDETTERLYQDNGIIHILSISGLHITIIGMSLYRLLRKVGFPVWLAAIFGGIVLVLYGIMTGMSVSACRAIGMFLIRMLAEICGRTYDMLTALGVCGAVMVGVNPEYLKNAGFLLSYGSIIGIGVFYPALVQVVCGDGEKVGKASLAGLMEGKASLTGQLDIVGQIVKGGRLEKLNWLFGMVGKVCGLEKLRDSLLASLSITFTTLPILLWFYYEVSIYSVFLNLCVLPFMSMVMLSGLCAMLIPGLGVVGTVDYLILSGYEWLCKVFGNLPGAVWNPGKPQLWQMMLYYMVWLGIVLGQNLLRERKNKFFFYLAMLLSVAILGIHFPAKTSITFLDVGQGDCICVQLESGEVYLFDCGSTSRRQIGKYVLQPYLKFYGINHIDGVFLSHPDKDHCNGIMELLQNREAWRITIGQIFISETVNEEEGSGKNDKEGMDGNDVESGKVVENGSVGENGWQELLNAVGGQIPVTVIGAGDYWEVDGNRFLCLHPPKGELATDANVYSQCFYIKLKEEVTLLLTGDTEAAGEEMLVERLQKEGIDEVTVLKVAHHGSRNATGNELLQQLSPKLAVISCGRDNSYGHPHREVLERLDKAQAEVVTTSDNGAIMVEIGKKVKMRGWKK